MTESSKSIVFPRISRVEFKSRSSRKELIDAPGIPFADWHVCLRELDLINTWLGGHQTTIQGLKSLLPDTAESVTIAEIGCGGGDNLNAIHAWNQRSRNPRTIRFIGIDLNEACVEFARNNCKHLRDVSFVHADYRETTFEQQPDFIFSSLFCHHLARVELTDMLIWLRQNAGKGFFINDLHRHPLAYYSIGLLTALFSRSYLVKHDAPVSVLRGFRRNEWEDLLRKSGFSQFSIRWRWAFRYLITVNYA